MKKVFSVLILTMGLGNFFSVAQSELAAKYTDPYTRYVASEANKRPELTLVRFAAKCGIELSQTMPRYAVFPDNKWVRVNDLSKKFPGLETDFFSTVTVRKQADRVLVEEWVMELDVATEDRTLYCFEADRTKFVESTTWNLPVASDDKISGAWGYEQRWQVDPSGIAHRTLAQFVDYAERPIAPVQLDEQTKKDLHWTPQVKRWKDLSLPSTLLQ